MNHRPEHLVIQAPNWLGDTIMAQPAMRAFHDGLRARRVSICGRPWLADVLPYLDLANTRYEADFPRNADICVMFPNSFRAAWNALKSGAKQRIGYRTQGRTLLLTDAFPPRIDVARDHHRLYYNDLAISNNLSVTRPEVRLACPPDAVEQGREQMQKLGLDAAKTICIAPGAQFGGAKRYPAVQWREALRLLVANDFHFIALGTAAERGIAAEALADCGRQGVNLAGETTLAECLRLLSASRGLLCNDSGLMHVAAGLGKPIVAVFGATDPRRTSPSGPLITNNNSGIIFHPAACSPCLRRECTVQGQPCMRNVSPIEVAETFLAQLDAAIQA